MAGREAAVFLLDEPTAGVDVGAKADIMKLVRDLADGGAGVLLVSSEFDVLIRVCDRILVVRNGRVLANIVADAASEHDLMRLAGGAQLEVAS